MPVRVRILAWQDVVDACKFQRPLKLSNPALAQAQTCHVRAGTTTPSRTELILRFETEELLMKASVWMCPEFGFRLQVFPFSARHNSSSGFTSSARIHDFLACRLQDLCHPRSLCHARTACKSRSRFEGSPFATTRQKEEKCMSFPLMSEGGDALGCCQVGSFPNCGPVSGFPLNLVPLAWV